MAAAPNDSKKASQEASENPSSRSKRLARNAKRKIESSLPVIMRRERLQDLKQSNRFLKRTNAELELLHTISSALSSTLNLDRLFQLVLRQVTRSLGYDRALIMLVDRNRRVLHSGRILGATRRVRKGLKGLEIPLDLHYDVFEKVIEKRKPYVANPDQITRATGIERDLIDFLGTKSFAVLPLISKKRLVGILWVDHLRKERRIEEGEMRSLAQVAAQVAIAIDNAQAYQTITELNQSLEAKVVERTRDLERTGHKLKEAFKSLKQLDDFKNKFFTHISHELRTPLTLLLAPVDLLLERENLPDEDRRILSTIKANARQLLKMINALLDLSKINAGKMQLRFQQVDVCRTLRAIYERVLPLAQTCGVALRIEIPEACRLYIDPDQFILIIQNLLTNALNFTDKGGEVVLLMKEEAEIAIIEVRDTGTGIASGDLPHIFEHFVHGQGGRVQGTGIGLALARELVDLHGGTLKARSIVGSGTVMVVELRKGKSHLRPEWIIEDPENAIPSIGVSESDATLPLTFSEEQAEPAIAPNTAPTTSWKILVVEDHPEMRAYLAHVLSQRYQVVTASRGEQGLEIARSQQPDLVLTDVAMAGMTGYDLCEALKKDVVTRNVPVIVLTAHIDPDETVKALEYYGADDYITKPFHARELTARVERLLRVREMQAQLLHVEKLASLGQLSAGLAHEINNPLGFIKSGLTSLKKHLAKLPAGEGPEDSRTQMDWVVTSMDEGIDRIRNLIRDLRDYSRSEGSTIQRVSLQREVDLCLQILNSKIRDKRIEVVCHLDEVQYLYAQGSQIGQVLMNLIHNAVQATGAGGRITINARKSAGEIFLEVRDTGPGIAKENLRRIFTPFFTTKPPGEGVGLGLSICDQIVRSHGGSLRVESQPGQGAAFLCHLPQPTVSLPDAPPKAVAEKAMSQDHGAF